MCIVLSYKYVTGVGFFFLPASYFRNGCTSVFVRSFEKFWVLSSWYVKKQYHRFDLDPLLWGMLHIRIPQNVTDPCEYGRDTSLNSVTFRILGVFVHLPWALFISVCYVMRFTLRSPWLRFNSQIQLWWICRNVAEESDEEGYQTYHGKQVK